MKRVIFISCVCLLLIALIVPACAAPAGKTIKVGVIGPMQFLEGEGHWAGAEMARDKINDAGGINLGGEKYRIELIKADSNEILSPADAASAMERLITVDKVDFVIGGFRTEAVFPMQDVAMDYKKIFVNCGAATMALQKKVLDDYDRYKYFFKGTPYNEYFLVNSDFLMLGMVGAVLKQQLDIPGKLKVAVVAEKLTWADAMVKVSQDTIPKLGMEVTGVWRPSDTATDVNAELTAIAATEPHIIFTTFSGPVGVTYGKQVGELQIPACSVGINVEAQKKGYVEATGGKGNYILTLNTYAKGVKITDKTIPFFDEFEKRTGEYPSYTAATYDVIHILKQVVEEAQTLDPDALVPIYEKIDYIGTSGRIKLYPPGPESQPPKVPHDLVYGPGYVTGIGTQWQDGELKCVWPVDWEGLTYEGTVPYKIPPAVLQKYKAAQAPTTTPPAAGKLSFEAAEYTNADLGFSVRYPKEWVKQTSETTLFYAAAPDKVPVLLVDAEEGATLTEALTKSLEATGGKDVKVQESETALADGTKAVQAIGKWKNPASPFALDIFALGAMKDGKWVIVAVSTVGMMAKFDEAKFSEIAHTLQFTK